MKKLAETQYFEDSKTIGFPVPLQNLCYCVFLSYIVLAVLTTIGVIGTHAEVSNLTLAYQPPDISHWLGTDIFGRDLWNRNLHAIKTATTVGIFSTLLSCFLGTIFGALAGYFSGTWIDIVIRWIYTTIDSVPYILLLTGLSFALGQGLHNLYLVLGATGWVRLCRLVRSEFLKSKEQDFVLAARASGASRFHQAWHHILPRCRSLILVQMGLFFVVSVKMEVLLSFLGLGVEIGTPSWGSMLDDARGEMSRGIWWNFTAVSVLFFLMVFSVNVVLESLQNRKKRVF